MKIAFAILLAVHGAIHVLGFVKAFRLAPVQQLQTAIARPMGIVWLAAALAYLATAVLLFASPERWWWAGAVAIVLSQAAIFSAWTDAKLGTIPNIVVLVPLVLALLDTRPSSLDSMYRTEVERALIHRERTPLVTEADLAPLPAPVQTYLRRVGVVGHPRVQSFRAEWRGQMKNGVDAGWMNVHAEQVEAFDGPTRLYHMTASRSGIPFTALHVYEGTSASMRVRVASVFDVIDAHGPEMDRSETVMLFNDICLLAPAALLDADVTWRPLDEHRVAATFNNGPLSVTAELVFDATGDLVDFVSTDRAQSADGKTFRRLPWSTPVREYRSFGDFRLPAVAEAMWTEPSGPWAYARFELVDIEYNVTAQRWRRTRHGVGRVATETWRGDVLAHAVTPDF